MPIDELSRQLIKPEHAKAMDRLLFNAAQSGTGRAASVLTYARGKTGTINNGVDALFIGYSPFSQLVTAIWMGNDDNSPLKGASGGLVADLWGSYMKKAPADVTPSG